jgi:hypothetical protein
MNQKQRQLISTYFPELMGSLTADTSPALDSLLKMLVGKVEMAKGDPGYTPIKGKDYWTDAEINQVIEYIRKMVVTKDILEAATPIKGVHYKDGEDGSDYILTSKDKKEIASQIDVPIVDKVIERTEIIKEISKTLEVGDIKDAVSKKDLDINNRNLLSGMARIDGRIKLIDQRWHGGGLSKVVTDATLSGSGTASSPLTVISAGSGTGYSIENLSSQISAGNVTFTAVHFPVYLVVDNGTYFANEDFTISGDDVIGYTIVMSFPPTTSIRDFYGGGGSTPTVDYLTDSNGNILTDSNGSPLTVN